jgi:protoheme IX farnesyltransferase
MIKKIFISLETFGSLVKSPQTLLLAVTGVAGFMTARCPVRHWTIMAGLIISLLTSIAGSTVLNMWFDHDIDKVMARTHHRPLSQGSIDRITVFWIGTSLSFLGVAIGYLLSPLYSLILFLGILFDVVIYTIWLKRLTCWSIIWGGIAGGMPILAGRVLGMGHIDLVGILLTLSVLFWIPTHMLTFSIHYMDDYAAAKIPTFPSIYNVSFTRKVTAFSTIFAAALVTSAAVLIQVNEGFLHLLGILSGVLVFFTILMLIRPTRKINFGLFKFASIYMLAAMLLLAI